LTKNQKSSNLRSRLLKNQSGFRHRIRDWYQ